MPTPKLSVIIPTFNREQTIRETLNSVRSQTFHDFELIVVDDGSTDRTCEVVSEYDEVTLVRQQNAGPGAARNTGVKHASGDHVAFLDSDDLWFPWTLETFHSVIETVGSFAIIASSIVEFSAADDLNSIQNDQLAFHEFSDLLSSQKDGNYFVGAGMLVVNRKQFEDCGGFSDKITVAEDHDLAIRMGTSGKFISLSAPPCVAWRRHENSTTTNLELTVEGMKHLLWCENNGIYPGGEKRRHERLLFISARVRPVILECVRAGRYRDSSSLYLSLFRHHAQTRRWRFLLGYFTLLCYSIIKSPFRKS